MKQAVLVILLQIMILAPRQALAHRIDLFCRVNDNVLTGEGYFSNGDPVKNGKISVTNAINGEPVAETATSDDGTFSTVLDNKAPVVVVLSAGQGHRAIWRQPAGDRQKTATSFPHESGKLQPLKTAVGLLFIAVLFGLLYYWKRKHATRNIQ